MTVRAVFMLCLLAGPCLLAQCTIVLAQAEDCSALTSQADMNVCAARAFDAADKALNVQWKLTRAVIAARDSGLDADMKTAEKALARAQRAWIEYRDGQCEVQGFAARGGSLLASCKTSLTQARTRELKALAAPQ